MTITDPTVEMIQYGTADVSIRCITPSDAAQMLEYNEVNRSVRRDLVAAYRRDMNQGKWRFTGEAIQFSRTGALLNGQHRLTALAGSKAKRVQDGIDFVVVTGLPDDAQALMDQGAPRSIRDALTIQYGTIKNINLVGSIARWLTVQLHVDSEFSANVLRNKVSTAEVLETYRKHGEEISEAAYQAMSWRRVIPGSPTALGYTYVQFSRINREACNEFFAGMADMDWQWREDPRKAALRRLQIMVGDNDYRANIENAAMTVSLFTRAWNLWRKEENVTTLMVRGSTGLIKPVIPS